MRVVLILALVACSSADPGDPDLDDDPELAQILDNAMPDVEVADGSTVEVALAAGPHCTKHRFLHVANFSFVEPLSECVNGACPNGCWGYQRRTSGFTCDYAAT